MAVAMGFDHAFLPSIIFHDVSPGYLTLLASHTLTMDFFKRSSAVVLVRIKAVRPHVTDPSLNLFLFKKCCKFCVLLVVVGKVPAPIENERIIAKFTKLTKTFEINKELTNAEE